MPPSFSLQELHYNLGHVLEQQGDLTGAIESYRQAIALQPNTVNAYNNLGCVLTRLGEFAEAIQVYQRAIALQPDWAVLYHNLGHVLTQQGNDPETLSAAIAAYRRAIALQPDLELAHSGLGKLLHQQGQHNSAIEHFQQAIRQNPTNWDTYTNAAFTCIALGEYDRAFSLLHSVIQAQQPLVQAYWQWTETLGDRTNSAPDEFVEARMACGRFLKALHQPPPTPIICQHLADIYFHLANVLTIYGGSEQYQQAQTYYKQALQLQPDRLDASLELTHCLLKQAQAKTPSAIARSKFAFYTSTQEWINTHPAKAEYHSLEWVRLNPTQSSQTVENERKPDRPASPVTVPSSCHGLNCKPCLQRLFNDFQLAHLGHGVYRCTGTPPLPIHSLPLFVVTIPQGKSWAVPQQNDWFVCNAIAVFTADDHLLSDLSRDYPGHLPHCPHPSTQYQRLPFQHLPAPTSISGTVAVLTGLSGHNYYHWMVDVLPRFALLQQSGFEIDQIDRVFLNATNQPFQRATLAALGISLEKILESDRQPHIQADRLLVPAFAGPLGWLEPWAMDWLRQQFLPLATPIVAKTKLPERIYISRNCANHRRVLNEAALIEQLQSYDFTPIQLETLSFAEQVALFAHAKIIIAPHGGGLTNLVFCRPGTIVLELVNPAYIRHYYWVISQPHSLQHYLVMSQPFVGQPLRQLMYPTPLLEDLWIDINSLVEFLQTLRAE
jgi:capsular polysaccharide biosynthesis protein/tetratricopeptide (TPR) repeat protein